MSFILDALKKSEHERQDRTGPDLAYAPGVRERESLPRWVYILGALLLVNLVALGGMFLFDGPSRASRSPDPVAAVPGPQTPPEPVAESAAVRVSQGAYTKTPADQAEVLAGAKATTSAGTTPPPSRETKGPNPARPLQREADGPGKESAAVEGSAGMTQAVETQPEPARPAVSYSQESIAEPLPPTLEQLHGQGKLMSLQSLSLDLHVYTEAAEGRFVFVNLNRYREGERLREGPLVEQITPDGVILQHMGERFLVPRS